MSCTYRNPESAMSTTVGVKLDDATRQRLKAVADQLDRTPHWAIKTALIEWLDREETALKERHDDEARWARYVESGQGVDQARVMQWLDALAGGGKDACPK
jgi:RHH-type proline utilization regulon transcriptional repressor/proline dehydrogenase/delta 1-pyrroline-5-carboxylate dehydrogenase